jgi:signal transduction histidine kinase
MIDNDPAGAHEALARAHEELAQTLVELRELARGLHPGILADHGLEPALAALAQRSPVPVEVTFEAAERPSDAVEVAAYYVIAESLTNVAKYAQATVARVEVRALGDRLLIEVADDGVGGADHRNGSGLRGLEDRVEALGGRLHVESVPGEGTSVRADVPVTQVAPRSEVR